MHMYDLLDTQIRRVDVDLRRLETHFGLTPPLTPGGAAAASVMMGTAAGGAAAASTSTPIAVPPGAVTVVTVSHGKAWGCWMMMRRTC